MKQATLYHRPLLGAMLLATLLAACGETDDLSTPVPEGQAGKSYVTLSFTMPTEEMGSRTNPTGGEDGDGHEAGQSNENTISTAVAFFFQNEGAGVNGDGNTPVSYMHFDSFEPADGTTGSGNIDRVYKTKPVPTSLYGDYNVLVVANPGSDNWWTSTTTLGQLRDKILSTVWTDEDGKETNFMMSSAHDATISITNANNTTATAANATVDVERLAARVDYKKDAEYTCTDTDFKGGKVEITGAVLVNNLTAPGTYAMKRVSATTDASSDVTYLGDETADTNGAGTNWVRTPSMDGKDGTTTFGVNWKDTQANDPNWWSAKAKEGTSINKADNEQWNILGYTQEYTTAINETSHEQNTAVVFKAKFTPATNSVSHYKEGATFFELGNTLYASMEDMMADFEDQTTAQMDAAITNCTSWEDVKTFFNKLRDDDPCGYKKWLQTQITETTNLTDEVKQRLKWSSYMLNECGYSAIFENNIYTVTIDQNDNVTADILAEYGARTYEDATCYYTWWIRHANDGDDKKNGIMEYAIVRNNIYELDVKSIYSLGGYIPNEEEHGFIVNVYVKDWVMLPGETIQM